MHNSLASCLLLPWQVGQSNVSNTTYNILIWYLMVRKRKNLHLPCNTTLILIICLYFQHFDNVLIRQNLFIHIICLPSFSPFCRYIQWMKMSVSVDRICWRLWAMVAVRPAQCPGPLLCVHQLYWQYWSNVSLQSKLMFSVSPNGQHTKQWKIDKYYFVPQIFAFNSIARAGDEGDVCWETGPAGRLFVF